MCKLDSIPIIYSENPISRAYINVLKDLNLTNTEIIFLGSGYKYKLIHKLFFRSNIHPANIYLKNKDISYLVHQIEDFFSLRRNFVSDMYNFSNILDFERKSFCVSPSLKTADSIKFIRDHSSQGFLNTGKEILKDVLNQGKQFYHLHPGYLPKIRGADSSLHSIDKLENVGCTFFLMSAKIDKGKVFKRIELPFNDLEFKNYTKFKLRDLYRIWYYFFDNTLRAYLYKKIITEGLSFSPENEVLVDLNEHSSYYSFMNNKSLERTFGKIYNQYEFN